MFITNVRLGHATNSSSSHSLVVMSRPVGSSYPAGSWEFGWEDFTLTDADSKMRYLALQLQHNLGAGDGVRRIIGELVGIPAEEIPGTDYHNDFYVYIDHQSIWSLPGYHKGNGGTGVNLNFAAFLGERMKDDDIVVLGGNDNSDGHPLLSEADKNITPDWGGMIAREQTNFWTLYTPRTGAKVRISKTQEAPARADAPELVDIKITDYCPFGCTFCYQGSTLKGEHAQLRDVQSIAYALSTAEVFEVAIGGGEPTLHPDFPAILKTFHQQGITPNFTTRNKGWMKEGNELAELVKEIGCAFAFSAENPEDVAEVKELAKAAGLMNFNFHYIMGIRPLEEMGAFLKAVADVWIGDRVTLLGYKTTERGAEYIPHKYDGWFQYIEGLVEKEKAHNAEERRKFDAAGGWRGGYKMEHIRLVPDISIDTTLAKQSSVELADVNPRMYHTEEGAFSAYIDAVSMTLAPSSYEPQREHAKFDPYGDWLKVFQSWDIDPGHEARISDKNY